VKHFSLRHASWSSHGSSIPHDRTIHSRRSSCFFLQYFFSLYMYLSCTYSRACCRMFLVLFWAALAPGPRGVPRGGLSRSESFFRSASFIYVITSPFPIPLRQHSMQTTFFPRSPETSLREDIFCCKEPKRHRTRQAVEGCRDACNATFLGVFDSVLRSLGPKRLILRCHL
jgi:hypothetical protein